MGIKQLSRFWTRMKPLLARPSADPPTLNRGDTMPKKNPITADDLHSRVAEELRRFRGTEWKNLRLVGLGLTEIPKEVFELADLESIDLSENHLRSIPERLW